MDGPREGQGIRTLPFHGKAQATLGFPSNTGTDPLAKQLETSGPIASRGRSVRPSVKYVDMMTKKGFQEPPPHPSMELSGSAHALELICKKVGHRYK